MAVSKCFLVLFGVALVNTLLFILYVTQIKGYTVLFLATLHGPGSGPPGTGNSVKDLLVFDQSQVIDSVTSREQMVVAHSAQLLSTQEERDLNRGMSAKQGSVRYLLPMVYAEQLTSATKHYVSLVNIAIEWGMKSVEPLITESRLYGTQCLYGPNINKSFYHYSRFFNITQVDRELSECLIGPNASVITSRTSFLCNSYRDMTVVHFVNHKPLPIASHCVDSRGNKPYFKEFEERGNGMIDCTGVAAREGMKTAVEQTLNTELDRNDMSDVTRFKVSRVICIDATKAVSLTALKEFVQSGGDRESVLFVYWQGQRTAESFTGGRVVSRCSVSVIQHSDEVSKTASMFISSLGLKWPFLSLHIRSERIIHSNSLHHGYWACCLERLHSLISNITRKYNLKDVLLVRDYGKYGTDSCFYGNHTKPHQYCRMLSDRMMTEIGQWGITYSAFDPVKFKTVDNSGFVSLVEADILLQGHVLLTVGYGSFQGLLKERFIHQASSRASGSRRAYHICPSYKEKEVLHELLSDVSCEDLLP